MLSVTRALPPGRSLTIRGAVGSLPAFAITYLLTKEQGPTLVLTAEADSAEYVRSDLEQILGSDNDVLLFPPTGRIPYDPNQLQDASPLVTRADALTRLREGFGGVLIASAESRRVLASKVPMQRSYHGSVC